MWILWGIIQILSLAALSSQVLTSWMMISNMAPCGGGGSYCKLLANFTNSGTIHIKKERCNEKDYPYTLPLNVDMHVNRAEALALSTSSTNPPALPEVVKVDISVEIFLKPSF